MKKLLFCLLAFLLSASAQSQNVGINTQTPVTTLDVRGGFRVGGINNFLLYDSASGKFTWRNSYLFLPTPQYIIQHSASAEGLYYSNSRLQYLNSTGNPVFFSDWSTGNGYFSGNLGIGLSSPSAKLHVGSGKVRMEGPSSPGGTALSIGGAGDVQVDANGIVAGRFVIKENGNVGIGNPSPGFPLNFANSLGDKISLWGSTGSHYGLGIQSSLLQIHTDGAGADIAFGYGSSSSFTEQMRIKGNGVLQFPPTLAKKITLYPGGTGDAGFAVFGNELRIASDYNGADITFGFDNRSTGFTEKFRLSANGAFSVNGNAGQSGQVLTSNGNSSPQWTSSTNALFNNTNSVVNQDALSLTTSNGFVVLPGMLFSLSLTGNTKVFFSYVIPAFAIGCSFCGQSSVFIDLRIDGGTNNRSEWDIANGAHETLSFSKVVTLGAGNHVIQIAAEAIGPTVQFGGCCIYDKILNVQVIPQ
jgi:hypothetical protein